MAAPAAAQAAEEDAGECVCVRVTVGVSVGVAAVAFSTDTCEGVDAAVCASDCAGDAVGVKVTVGAAAIYCCSSASSISHGGFAPVCTFPPTTASASACVFSMVEIEFVNEGFCEGAMAVTIKNDNK